MSKVLFVCTHNAAERSQMAEALFSRLAPDDVRALSAPVSTPASKGLRPEVVGGLTPPSVS